MEKQIMQYVRDDNNQKVGVMVALVNEKDEVRMGFSKTHPHDEFNKKVGIQKAVGRARSKESLPQVPFKMQSQWEYFGNRVMRWINGGNNN